MTLAVSLLALCAGLALTAHQVYRTRLFLAAQAEWRKCYAIAAPPSSPLKKQLETLALCRGYSDDHPLPAVPYAGMRFLANTLRMFPEGDPDILNKVVNRFTGFAFTLSIGVTVVLVALPWAVFYFARWLARGFADSS